MTATSAITLTKQSKVISNRPTNETNTATLTVIRLLVILSIFLAYQQAEVLQSGINILWEFLRHQWWYKTVYHETFLVEIYSFPVNTIYHLPHVLGFAQNYRIETGGAFDKYSFKEILIESWDYAWPLVILDTFHVKHYAGVADDVISEKRTNWIQTTRALPEKPPLLKDVVRHLIVAVVVYDACFFLQHLIFHKSPTLYRWFHYKHHEHDSVTVKVTDKLHTVERILLVLSANLGLKIQGAHPLTRTFFIFVFIVMLIDNHSGYDFPYSYEKILPRGVIGGSKRHFAHHQYGTRNYQPIFTYLDHLVELIEQRKETSYEKEH